MKKIIVAFILVLQISSAQAMPLATVAPAPAPQQKYVPYNGSYNGNYSYPKPSYYENGVPVYVNGGSAYNSYASPRRQKRDSFPHYGGVVN